LLKTTGKKNFVKKEDGRKNDRPERLNQRYVKGQRCSRKRGRVQRYRGLRNRDGRDWGCGLKIPTRKKRGKKAETNKKNLEKNIEQKRIS